MTDTQRRYHHLDLGPGETLICELENGVGLVVHHSNNTDNPTCEQSPALGPSHLDTPFRYSVVPTHHSVNGLIGTACVHPSDIASEPAIDGHHTTALQGVWYTWAYKRVPTLEDVRNHLDFSQTGPIYVVTRGSRIGFFPSSSLAQQFTLHVTANASQRCSDMYEAYDYFARVYNEKARGGLGVQVLPSKRPLSNNLIDESHPLNQDDVILAVHPSGRVSIEREPGDDNPRFPISDLPPYSYHQAVFDFSRSEQPSIAPMAPPPAPIVIIADDSDEEDIVEEEDSEYEYPGDLSQLSTESYDEIEAIDRALTLINVVKPSILFISQTLLMAKTKEEKLLRRREYYARNKLRLASQRQEQRKRSIAKSDEQQHAERELHRQAAARYCDGREKELARKEAERRFRTQGPGVQQLARELKAKAESQRKLDRANKLSERWFRQQGLREELWT